MARVFCIGKKFQAASRTTASRRIAALATPTRRMAERYSPLQRAEGGWFERAVRDKPPSLGQKAWRQLFCVWATLRDASSAIMSTSCKRKRFISSWQASFLYSRFYIGLLAWCGRQILLRYQNVACQQGLLKLPVDQAGAHYARSQHVVKSDSRLVFHIAGYVAWKCVPKAKCEGCIGLLTMPTTSDSFPTCNVHEILRQGRTHLSFRTAPRFSVELQELLYRMFQPKPTPFREHLWCAGRGQGKAI